MTLSLWWWCNYNQETTQCFGVALLDFPQWIPRLVIFEHSFCKGVKKFQELIVLKIANPSVIKQSISNNCFFIEILFRTTLILIQF